MDSNFPKLSRRDFFKGLIAVGIVATVPQAKALPVVDKKIWTVRPKNSPLRYYAIWQPPGQKPKLTMFTGDIPADAEIIQAGGQYILRFPRYHDAWKPA